jgi:hypothetical protein
VVLVVASATSNSVAATVLQVLSDTTMLVLLGGWPGAAARASGRRPADGGQVMSRRTTSRVPTSANASA